ncbi:MAG: phosphoenolpyruvate carboxylase [Sandaracinaceae bacterium]|nr:phosphoenolpyruvate carboxylase [Sandaracinaceae bacterium]
MSEDVSDLLEVLVLAREVGVRALPVPLFETRRDLSRAHEVLREALAIPAYRARLERDVQEVMIGYSDSNKDAGFFAAHWSLYEAQRRMAEVAREAGVRFRFFHGRGTSIGRGGGPMVRGMLGQPPGTIGAGLRITGAGRGARRQVQPPAERAAQPRAGRLRAPRRGLDAPRAALARVERGHGPRRRRERARLPRAGRGRLVPRLLPGRDAHRGDRAPAHRLAPRATAGHLLAPRSARHPVGDVVDAEPRERARLVRPVRRARRARRGARARALRGRALLPIPCSTTRRWRWP